MNRISHGRSCLERQSRGRTAPAPALFGRFSWRLWRRSRYPSCGRGWRSCAIGSVRFRREGNARPGRGFRHCCDRWYGHGEGAKQRGDRSCVNETSSFDYHTLFPQMRATAWMSVDTTRPPPLEINRS